MQLVILSRNGLARQGVRWFVRQTATAKQNQFTQSNKSILQTNIDVHTFLPMIQLHDILFCRMMGPAMNSFSSKLNEVLTGENLNNNNSSGMIDFAVQSAKNIEKPMHRQQTFLPSCCAWMRRSKKIVWQNVHTEIVTHVHHSNFENLHF